MVFSCNIGLQMSHGCVRVPMHVADIFPWLVPGGTRVYLRG